MTEQTQPEQDPDKFDPADFTVDEVNTYLADADDAEVARVLKAEADGQARKGIVEGPHAAQDGPEDPAEGETPTSYSQGFHGDLANAAERGAKTVTEAAEHDEDEKGYRGTLPDADNRPDLTLQGVLGQNRKG